MATAEALMNVGFPAEQALRTGYSIVTVTTTADTQNSAGGLLRGSGNKIVLATAAAANGAVTLPADAGIGDEFLVYVGTSAGRLFVPTGGTINQSVTPNQHVAMAVNTSMHAVRVTATNWRFMPAGIVTPA